MADNEKLVAEVMAQLATVMDPELNRDLVSLGKIYHSFVHARFFHVKTEHERRCDCQTGTIQSAACFVNIDGDIL